MVAASKAVGLALLVSFLVVRPAAAPAAAELVLLTTGRTLALSGHKFEGDRVVLYLRNGGEVVCDRSLIVRIEPDAAPAPPVQVVVELRVETGWHIYHDDLGPPDAVGKVTAIERGDPI